MQAEARQRIDKFLWFARIVKTRALARALVEAGHVRINRSKVTKPGHDVRPGDVLTVALHAHVRVLRVSGLAERRGTATTARLLCEELAMSNRDGAMSQKQDAMGAGTC